jgi:hypothetical protein
MIRFKKTTVSTVSKYLSLLALAVPAVLQSQVTTINVNNQVIQSPVKRFGINLGSTNFYDSGQMLKNLIINNPGFEGEIAQSMIQCGSGTANSCTHANPYSGWSNDFWDGATYQFVYGTALGRSGTVSTYTAANGTTGGVFNFSDSGVVPGNSDYMIVRKPMPGNATDGWQVSTFGAGSVSTNLSDLPPGTQGIQTASVNAPTSNDSAALNYYFDSTPSRTFIQLNGQYQLTFKAKGLSAGASVGVQVYRSTSPRTIYINSAVTLTNDWQTYTIPFTASENGSVIGTAQVQFYTVGADSFYLDDASLVQLNTDSTNTTVFRDPVVKALKQLNPGILRFWFNQLGEPLDNMLAPPLGRQRSTYNAYATDIDFVEYGLTDFLQLCQTVGADPWVVVPITLSNAEASNLIDYLAGPTSTVYGAKRAAAGQTAPWTSVFNKIHLEFGNEAWDAIFNGGDMEIHQAYGTRTQAVFAAMRSNANFNAPSFDLIMNGQAIYAPANTVIQSYCNNNDSFAAAPYMMYTVNDPADAGFTGAAAIEDLFGSAFAEAEAFVTPSGTAEGVANGYVLQDQLALQASGKPFITTEFNIAPYNGDITQAELNGFTSSIGGGLSVISGMLQQLRAGVLTQNLFQLAQFINPLPTSTSQPAVRNANLFGSVVDMGVTDWRRPQFLALQMANNAISTASANMLQTVHTGANPTWNQPLVQDVQLNNAHYLQSFAFNNGSQYSLIVINTNRTTALPVTFAGYNVPAGNVQLQQLTSANITDNNENALVVAPVSSTLTSFNPATPLSLPPFSMTVLTWTAPQISSVTVTGITATTATITWTTDVAASGQVNYGTTASYGSQSTSTGASTTQSVTLTGLTAGVTYDFAVSATNAGGATSTSQNATFTTLASFSLSAPASISVQQGQSNTFPVTVTPTNGYAGSVSLSLSGLPTGVSGTLQATSTGASLVINVSSTVPTATYPLTITGTAGTVTMTAPVSLVVSAAQQSQSITFNAIPSQIAGGTLALSATASSGLAVSYTSATTSVCAVSGSTASLLATGTCTITASQAGNSMFAPATPVSQSFTVQAATSTTTTVSLGSAANIYGIFNNGSSPTNGGLDTSGYAYSANLLGASLTFHGIPYSFGTPGSANAASSTTIALPAGSYSALNFLGTAIYGNQTSQTFTVTYTDGTTSTFTQSMSDWGAPQNYTGETVASAMAYRLTPSGAQSTGQTWNLYAYSFALNSTKTVKSFTLPNVRNVTVVAVTLSGSASNTAQTITFGAIAGQTAGTTLALTATASSGLAVSYASTTTSVCTVSGNTATLLTAGTCTITASQAGNSTYAAAISVSQSFTVAAAALKSQTITFNAIPAQTVGSTLTVSATASSGLPVTFTVVPNGNCSVSGSVVTFLNTGNCGVVANQAGNSVYAAAPAVGQIIVVNNPTPQTITFGTIAAQTVGTPLTLTATASSGLAVSYASSTTTVCTVSGSTATFLAAGTCTITASQAGNSTYSAAISVSQSFTVKAATLKSQTITFNPIPAQTVGKTLTVSATASSGLAVTFTIVPNGNCSISGSVVTFLNVGNCGVIANQAGNSTYAAAPAVGQIIVVNN